jgi:hypothetical protein
VNSQLSSVSFHLNCTSVASPLSTINPTFSVGDPEVPLFNSTRLSAIVNALPSAANVPLNVVLPLNVLLPATVWLPVNLTRSLAAATLASALAFVKNKFVEPSVISSVSPLS